MKPKTTRPSLKQVAADAGVGYATASRALSGRGYVAEQTRRRVEESAQRLGYLPNLLAKALREDRTKLIGVVLPNLVNEFYSDATQVIQEGLARSGFQMLVIAADTPHKQNRAVAELVEHKVAGIIQVPVHGADTRAAGGTPIVQLNRAELGSTPAVLCDDERGFRQLAQLLPRGSRVVAILGDAELSTTRARVGGITQVFPEARCLFGEYTASSGRRLCAEALDNGEPPDALIVASPRLMAGVLTELRTRKVEIPGDIALTGYDDPEWYSFFGTGITTFSPNHEAMGRRVVAVLLAMVADDAEVPQTPELVAGRVITRGSHRKGWAQ